MKQLLGRRVMRFPVGFYLFIAGIIAIGVASGLGLSDEVVFWLVLCLGLIGTYFAIRFDARDRTQ